VHILGSANYKKK